MQRQMSSPVRPMTVITSSVMYIGMARNIRLTEERLAADPIDEEAADPVDDEETECRSLEKHRLASGIPKTREKLRSIS